MRSFIENRILYYTGGIKERREVPRSFITWIIVGIIIGLAVLFITVVIVIYKYKRRSRARGLYCHISEESP